MKTAMLDIGSKEKLDPKVSKFLNSVLSQLDQAQQQGDTYTTTEQHGHSNFDGYTGVPAEVVNSVIAILKKNNLKVKVCIYSGDYASWNAYGLVVSWKHWSGGWINRLIANFQVENMGGL